MRVRLSRTGGFTGIRRTFEVSDEALAPAEAASLRAAVARVRAAGLRVEGAPARPSGADRFAYELAVEDGAAAPALRFAPGACGEELDALAELVEELGAG
jgi:emfourin